MLVYRCPMPWPLAQGHNVPPGYWVCYPHWQRTSDCYLIIMMKYTILYCGEFCSVFFFISCLIWYDSLRSNWIWLNEPIDAIRRKGHMKLCWYIHVTLSDLLYVITCCISFPVCCDLESALLAACTDLDDWGLLLLLLPACHGQKIERSKVMLRAHAGEVWDVYHGGMKCVLIILWKGIRKYYWAQITETSDIFGHRLWNWA